MRALSHLAGEPRESGDLLQEGVSRAQLRVRIAFERGRAAVPLIAVVAISSFGVAGVGGGATFASLIVLGTMGLPIEVVAVLASVEPLIDMGRTALNVSDSMVAGITASHVAGGLDRSVLDDPEARVTAEAHVS